MSSSPWYSDGSRVCPVGMVDGLTDEAGVGGAGTGAGSDPTVLRAGDDGAGGGAETASPLVFSGRYVAKNARHSGVTESGSRK